MTTLSIVPALCAGILVSSTLGAQGSGSAAPTADCANASITTGTGEDSTTLGCRALRAGAIDATREPRLRSVLRSPVTALQFSGDTDGKKKRAQAQIGWLGRGLGGATVGGTISAEGPLDEDSPQTSLADLTGLADATTAGVNLSWYRWHPRVDVPNLLRVCKGIRDRNPDDERFKDLAPNDFDWCFSGSKRLTKAEWRLLDTVTTYAGLPLTFASGVKIGRQQYKYTDAASLTDSAQRRSPWSVGVAAGIYFPRSGFLISPSFEYARASKPGKSTQLCMPIGTDGALQCRSVTLGAPTDRTHQVAGLELRRFVSSTLGFSLDVKHDFEERVTAVQLPIYFLQSKVGLNGGVSPGWRSDDHALTLGVFVGAMAPPVVRAPEP